MVVCDACKDELRSHDGVMHVRFKPAQLSHAEVNRLVASGTGPFEFRRDEHDEIDLCHRCAEKALDAIGFGLQANTLKPIEIPEPGDDDDEPPLAGALTPEELVALGVVDGDGVPKGAHPYASTCCNAEVLLKPSSLTNELYGLCVKCKRVFAAATIGEGGRVQWPAPAGSGG